VEVEEDEPPKKPVPARKPIKPAAKKPAHAEDDVEELEVVEETEVEEVEEIEEIEEIDDRPAKKGPARRQAPVQDEDDEEEEVEEDEDEDEDEDEGPSRSRRRSKRDRRRGRRGGIETAQIIAGSAYCLFGIAVAVLPFVLPYEVPTVTKAIVPVIGAGILGWGVFQFFKK
jgi:hypothetical protein